MYRKVILVIVTLSLGLTATLIWWMASRVTGLGPMRLPFLTGAVAWLLVGVLIAWAASFAPDRVYPTWRALVKYAIMAFGLYWSAEVIWYQCAQFATQTRILLQQAHGLSMTTLIAANGVTFLLQLVGCSLVLAVPLYWVIRGIGARSLRRATFEAWTEARRLVLPAVGFIILATVFDTYAVPSLFGWWLR